MEHFVNIIFPTRRVKKSVVEHMKKAAGLNLTESKQTSFELFESKDKGIIVKLELPRELDIYESDAFANKMTSKLFEMGYDTFDIEVSVSEKKALQEAARVAELDAIVDKYAKAGMTMADLEAMLREADGTKPQVDPEANVFSRIGQGLSKRLSTSSYRQKYVLAHAAWKLRLPGLYYPDGSGFAYIEDNTGEPKGAAGASLSQMLKIAPTGLLPDTKVSALRKNFKRYFPPAPGDQEARRIVDKIEAIEQAHNAAKGQAAPAEQPRPAEEPKPTEQPTTQPSSESNPYNGKTAAELSNIAYEKLQRLTALLENEGGGPSPVERDVAARNAEQPVTSTTPTTLRRDASGDNVVSGRSSDAAVGDAFGNESLAKSLYNILTEGASEDAEIAQLVKDLQLIHDAVDSSGKPILSDANRRVIKGQIARAADAVKRHNDRQTSDTDTGATTSPVTGGEVPLATELPPAGQDQEGGVADGVADADAADSGTASDSALKKFAGSGKGGLRNDPDEVDAIKELQQLLKDKGYDVGEVDGKYGPRTRAAVRKYQEDNNLTVDGDAGPETIGKLLSEPQDQEGGVADGVADADSADSGTTPEPRFKEGDSITPEIQELLVKAGRDKGIVGEKLTAEDAEALNKLADDNLASALAAATDGEVDDVQDQTTTATGPDGQGSAEKDGIAPNAEQKGDSIKVYIGGTAYYFIPGEDDNWVAYDNENLTGEGLIVTNEKSPRLVVILNGAKEGVQFPNRDTNSSDDEVDDGKTSGPDDGTRTDDEVGDTFTSSEEEPDGEEPDGEEPDGEEPETPNTGENDGEPVKFENLGIAFGSLDSLEEGQTVIIGGEEYTVEKAPEGYGTEFYFKAKNEAGTTQADDEADKLLQDLEDGLGG